MNNQQIANFLNTFRVEADSLASQTVTFDEQSGRFGYEETDVYGETACVRVIVPEGYDNVLELNGVNEEQLITELSKTFAELGSDVNAFVAHVEEKYKDKNQV